MTILAAEDKPLTRLEVIALMASSRSAQEWDDNCDRVKENLGGYPSYWYADILASGVAKVTMAKFGETDQLTFVTVGKKELKVPLEDIHPHNW